MQQIYLCQTLELYALSMNYLILSDINYKKVGSMDYSILPFILSLILRLNHINFDDNYQSL